LAGSLSKLLSKILSETGLILGLESQSDLGGKDLNSSKSKEILQPLCQINTKAVPTNL
jgi:hypothetical protein